MTLPFPIAPSQTDAKSPVDDNLMDSIRENLDYLDAQVVTSGAGATSWVVNGYLNALPDGVAKRIDKQLLDAPKKFTRMRVAQEVSGDGGVTRIDIRYHKKPKTPIKSITHQFKENTQSISRETFAQNTQAIAPLASNLNTQSITLAKPTANIDTIENLGGNFFRINFTGLIDDDWQIGFYVEIAGATDPNNNGVFQIVDSLPVNYPAIIISNPSGVVQSAPAGTTELKLFSYNFINPVPEDAFLVGLLNSFSGHTDSANDGSFAIFRVNAGGNNLWIANQNGDEQAGVAGSVACRLFTYVYSAPVPDYFRPNEVVEMDGHTNPANNGNFPLIYVNYGGDNVVVYSPNGVAQGSAAGEMRAYLWKYVFTVNPDGLVAVDDLVITTGALFPFNDGLHFVRLVNHTTANNIVVYNFAGSAQAVPSGAVTHTRKLVSFVTDQSLIYDVGESAIEIKDCLIPELNENDYTPPIPIVDVNFGGGANYNVVIQANLTTEQLTPAGYIAYESRSIFEGDYFDKPFLDAEFVGQSSIYGLLTKDFSGAIFKDVTVPENSYIGLFIIETMSGNPQNLSVHLS